MLAKTLLATAVLSVSALPVQAACLEEFDALQARFDQVFVEPAKGAEPSEATPVGLALTGDPLNPKPAEPSTAEVPTATPTSEEATSVMPGADASVELEVEQNTEMFSALRQEATALSEAGNEQGCMEKLAEAEKLFPSSN